MWCPKHSRYYKGKKDKRQHRQECSVFDVKLRNAELEEERKKKEERNV